MKKKDFFKLLTRKLSGNLTAEESRRLERIIQSDQRILQMASLFDEYPEGFESSRLHREQKLERVWRVIGEAEASGDPALRYDFAGRKTLSFRKTLLKAAALVLFVIASALFLYYITGREKPEVYVSAHADGFKIFKTLDDGTKVWLNKGTSIRYNEDFGKRSRQIYLQGEAFFDVTRNPAVPLFVHAGSIDIEVKGTAFNVRGGTDFKRIEVSLVHGLIQLTEAGKKDQSLLLRPSRKIIIFTGSPAGNRLSVNNIIVLSGKNLQQELKWTKDSLVFKKEKLKDLAVQLERKYDVKIEIRNEKLKDKRFSGIFRDELIREALDALRLSYPFTYTISGKLVIIK